MQTSLINSLQQIQHSYKCSESVSFTEAEETAQIPLPHHTPLECDQHGLEYTIEDHDITLRIPPAVTLPTLPPRPIPVPRLPLTPPSSPPPPLPPRGIATTAERIPSPVPLRKHKCPVGQTPQYNEANRIAQVPFLHHTLLECDQHGLEYTNEDHDITLRIPPEAVSAGEKIRFEIAVAMYGPFIFPDNSQPISPILWCCIEESSTLKKPFQVVLPHFLTGLTKEKASLHDLAFAKANHLNLTDGSIKKGQKSYSFQRCEVTPRFTTSGGRSFGILTTDHCCFFCLQADKLPDLDAGYCLARIESFISPQRSEVHFAAVYCLPSCLKVSQKNVYASIQN